MTLKVVLSWLLELHVLLNGTSQAMARLRWHFLILSLSLFSTKLNLWLGFRLDLLQLSPICCGVANDNQSNMLSHCIQTAEYVVLPGFKSERGFKSEISGQARYVGY